MVPLTFRMKAAMYVLWSVLSLMGGCYLIGLSGTAGVVLVVTAVVFLLRAFEEHEMGRYLG